MSEQEEGGESGLDDPVTCQEREEGWNWRSQKEHCGNVPSPELKWYGEGPQKPVEAGKGVLVTSSCGFPEPLEHKCQEDKLASQ